MGALAGWKFTLMPNRAGEPTTVSRNCLCVVADPSLTVRVIVALPTSLVVGCSVTNRLDPEPLSTTWASEMSVGFDEWPVTVRFPAGLSISPTKKAIGAVELLRTMLWSAMALMVGASLTGVTVSTKELVLLVPLPSVTTSVMVDVPDKFATG